MNDSGPRYKNTLLGMSFLLMGSTVTANAKVGAEANRPCQSKRYFMDVSHSNSDANRITNRDANNDAVSEEGHPEESLLDRRLKFVSEIYQRKQAMNSEGGSKFLERALRTRVGTSRMDMVHTSGGECTPPS